MILSSACAAARPEDDQGTEKAAGKGKPINPAAADDAPMPSAQPRFDLWARRNEVTNWFMSQDRERWQEKTSGSGPHFQHLSGIYGMPDTMDTEPATNDPEMEWEHELDDRDRWSYAFSTPRDWQ